MSKKPRKSNKNNLQDREDDLEDEPKVNMKMYIIFGVVGVVVILSVFLFSLKGVKDSDKIDNIIDDSKKQVEKDKKEKSETVEKEVGFYIPTNSEFDNDDYDEESYSESELELIGSLSNYNLLVNDGDSELIQQSKLGIARTIQQYNSYIDSEYDDIEKYYKDIEKEPITLLPPNILFSYNLKYDFNDDLNGENIGFVRLNEDSSDIYIGYPVLNQVSSLYEDSDEYSNDLQLEMMVYLTEDIKVEDLEKQLKSVYPKFNGVNVKTYNEYYDNDIKDKSDYFKFCIEPDVVNINEICQTLVDGDNSTIAMKAINSMEGTVDSLGLHSKHSEILELPVNRGEIILKGNIVNLIGYVNSEHIKDKDNVLSIGSRKINLLTEEIEPSSYFVEW